MRAQSIESWWQEQLDSRWLDRPADARLTTHEEPDRIATTELTGRVTDRAALMGILEQLYSLGVALVRVEHLGGHKRGASQTRADGM